MQRRFQLSLSCEEIPAGVLRELSAITDHASLDPDAVERLEDGRRLVVPISRVPFVEKRRSWGLGTSREYDPSTRIAAEIRIGRVVAVEVADERRGRASSIHLERGLTAHGHRLCLFSVEEDRGVPFYSLSAEVEAFELTVSDVSGDA